MKQVFYKISSCCLALLVFVSTLSFYIESHYCGDVLVDTSIFGHAKSCGMEVQQKSSSAECSFVKKDCCKDDHLIVNGQDELQLSLDKISFDQQIFLAAFVYTYINPLEGIDKSVTSFEEYKPPLVIRRIYKLDETYLI